MQWSTFFSVAVGGALGALARFYLAALVAGEKGMIFPLGTFAVNILGCFVIGLLYPLGEWLPPHLRVLLNSGFLGAFTTFSTFSLETVKLFTGGKTVIGLSYVAASLLLGLTAVLLGIKAGKLLMIGQS